MPRQKIIGYVVQKNLHKVGQPPAWATMHETYSNNRDVAIDHAMHIVGRFGRRCTEEELNHEIEIGAIKIISLVEKGE